jgi:hypothetical protein
MTPATATHLMQSIAANRLTILCGAGLSMAPPSSAPSAAAVASECANQYQRQVGQALEARLVDNIEEMARWFRQENRFEDLFINTLVPWARFNGAPNSGHEAIADFLACGVVSAGVTTNYDRLIESAAQNLGEPDFQAIVDIEDLGRNFAHRPFLKVHGCAASGRTRLATVWFREQLNDALIRDRTDRFRIWLQNHLFDRDVLIIGFWSDWAYLTDVFAGTVAAIGPRSVFLVDPSPGNVLQAKAPTMWDWAHRPGITFQHEQESGGDFLNSFREHFSRVFLRQMFTDAAETYQALFGLPSVDQTQNLEQSDIRHLYALRRDLTAVPRNKPVRLRETKPEYRVHTALHLRLAALGATYQGHVYQFNGESVRIINGAGELMSEVRRRYREEPPLPNPASRIVCVGVTSDATPANIMRPDEGPSVIRNGNAGPWTTADNFLEQLRAINV